MPGRAVTRQAVARSAELDTGPGGEKIPSVADTRTQRQAVGSGVYKTAVAPQAQSGTPGWAVPRQAVARSAQPDPGPGESKVSGLGG